MRILIIRLSSFGDVIHAFPAMTDAKKQMPNLTIDWVVEKTFAPLVALHPAVDQVIAIELRKWRKNWWSALCRGEIKHGVQQLRRRRYDKIIDVQGLIKSAIISRLANGKRYGYNKHSARESLSHWFYQYRYSIDKDQHAVERVRQLVAQSLAYELVDLPLDYGLGVPNTVSQSTSTNAGVTHGRPVLIFVHGTTWESKQWPIVYWRKLIELAVNAGYCVKLPAWGKSEIERATSLAQGIEQAAIPWIEPAFDVLLQGFKQANAIVSVDTGLSHLAAALNKPNIALLGATEAKHTGAYGPKQMILSSDFPCAPCKLRSCNHSQRFQAISPPCFEKNTPQKVWGKLQSLKGLNTNLLGLSHFD